MEINTCKQTEETHDKLTSPNVTNEEQYENTIKENTKNNQRRASTSPANDKTCKPPYNFNSDTTNELIVVSREDQLITGDKLAKTDLIQAEHELVIQNRTATNMKM